MTLHPSSPLAASAGTGDAPPTAPVGQAQEPGRVARHPLAFALVLTGLAGLLDAAAYLQFAHLYVSFMSGNSTHLGMALAERDSASLLAILGVVAAFVAGAALGTFIADRTCRHLILRVLILEAALMAVAIAAALAAHPLACVMMIALTMGIQNVLHQAVGGVDVGKGFVTGMLFHLGQSVARARDGKARLGQARISLLNWLSFVAGAAAGTLGMHALGFTACLAMSGVGILALILASWCLGDARAIPAP